MIEHGLLFSIGMAVVGFIVWLVRQEGRLNHQERLSDERHDQAKEKIANLEKDNESLRVKVEAIDSKVLEKLAILGEQMAEIRGLLRRDEKK